ncbi:MAG: diphosphomevalonate decarboxylase [Winogradskyella sp.]|nr:diphosphomevalonate decarboxylase [Winogradskyella sp.]MBT8376915.1 diphosphomevalonate decarboxylase [Bacteroidia bacterium]NNC46690.1 diphosphomevalonate decarboxylase [Winogradskyella sp.]NNF85074.1 diphosphomevalonate decarboxylase [Winogradskyella sp.]NNL83805.1 diphosphomevalonate decarboxylase [Winogradskyella sp.]
MTEQDFVLKSYKPSVEKGSVKWSSPSNIALVKYWGKKKNQIPENPSISFTLNDCKTVTELSFTLKNEDKISFDIYFEGERSESFRPKIETFFERIAPYVPFIKSYHFKIETTNTFPHSSGIASSASGMSALAMCIMSLEKQLIPEMTDAYFNRKASFLARLGSGSACRSIEGDLVVWGTHKNVEKSSDLYGVKLEQELHDVFKDYQDTILLVDEGEKQVSSTVGHNLMHGHPFAAQRFKQAHSNLDELLNILKTGELDKFIAIVESEALTLHAMMMTSAPYYILMKPNTLKIINTIWEFRAKTGSKVCFTLDAGANVHVLYPKSEKAKVYEFIKTQLVAYCQNGAYICDAVGLGAKQLH